MLIVNQIHESTLKEEKKILKCTFTNKKDIKVIKKKLLKNIQKYM